MAEYGVTGVRYQFDERLTHEERTRLAEEFLAGLENGTPMFLVAEPDNIKDSDAIAVYSAEVRKVGYIRRESCRELKPLLERDGMLEARVSGNDGHVTFFVEVPNAEPNEAAAKKWERVLPESPLPAGVFLPFTEDERTLQVVAPLLCEMKFTAENAKLWLQLSKRYLPLSRLSLSREDDLWRNTILRKFRAAMRLKMPENEHGQLVQMRDSLVMAQRDFHRSRDCWQGKLFEAQLDLLRPQAEGEDRLFDRFEKYAKGEPGGLPPLINRLREWFRAMPHVALCDCCDHQKLAEALSYQRVSRKELYDVYAAVLLLQRYSEPLADELVSRLKPIFYGDEKEARNFLSDIQDMKPRQITAKVTQLVREKKISSLSKGRELWTVLHDSGLYQPTESNWNMQVGE